MKTPRFVFAGLLACSLPLPFVSAQEETIFVPDNAGTVPPFIHQPADTQPTLPPELEREFLPVLAAAGPDSPEGPVPTRGAREFSIKISPPEEGRQKPRFISTGMAKKSSAA